jgi:hypothetical protein
VSGQRGDQVAIGVELSGQEPAAQWHVAVRYQATVHIAAINEWL